MEKDDFIRNDILGDLIRQSPLDSPSDGFVESVMANIRLSPEAEVVKKPFYLYLKAAIPYALVTLFLLLVIFTSDLPIFN